MNDAGTMNEVEELSARTNAGVRLVAIEELFESPRNPRQYYAQDGLNELAESMKATGFRSWLPIVARPRPNGGYEIAAGHRRRRAALLAGLTEVPCSIRAMEEAEFLDVLNFDNGGREGVHPLHEAAGWADWLAQTGKSVKDIASRIGKSKEYVYKRLQLVSAIEAVKRAFLDAKITQRHAEIMARYTPQQQTRALSATLPPAWNPGAEITSTRDLEEWCKKNLHLELLDAPFAIADETLLASAGSCTACPHRVGNLPDFDAMQDIPNVCTQPECYEKKIAAHIEAEKIRLTAEFGTVVCVSERNDTRTEGVLPRTEWHRAQPSEPNAKIALLVDGKQAGHTLSVLVQEKLPIAEPEPEPAPAKAPEPKQEAKPGKKQEAADKQSRELELAKFKREQQAREEREREAEEVQAREGVVRKALLSAILARVTWPPSKEDVGYLLEDWLSNIDADVDTLIEAQGAWPGNRTQPWDKLTGDQVARLVALTTLSDDLSEFHLTRGTPKLDAAAKRYGVDLAPVRKRAELECKAKASGIDFTAPVIECTPGKKALAEIRFRPERNGVFVQVVISLPVKASEGYGEAGPLIDAEGNDVWLDRGAAIDAALKWIAAFLPKVDTYSNSTEATRAAAEQVRRWVKQGQSARQAICELAALDAPPAKDGRKSAIAKLGALGVPAKKAVPAAAKKTAVQSPAKPSGVAKGHTGKPGKSAAAPAKKPNAVGKKAAKAKGGKK